MPGWALADSFNFATATPITTAPFIITVSGNYYLPANLPVSNPGAGIIVEAGEVVIDLNGRSIIAQGINTKPNVGVGIEVLNQEDVIIQNGDIDKFGLYGVLFDASDGKREHNQKNELRHVNFNNDRIGVLIVSGSIDVVEFCKFDGGSVGIYDIGSLGGDRFQQDNFENQRRAEVLNEGIGIVSTPGKGTLTEDCLFADDQDAGIVAQGAQDRLRFNTFVSDGATHIGGISLGAGDN